MVKNLNISKNSVLLELASLLPHRYPAFDLQRFKEDLFGEKAKKEFRKDLQECKYLSISRLPTILFKVPGKGSVLLSGYQSYEALKKAYLKLEDLQT